MDLDDPVTKTTKTTKIPKTTKKALSKKKDLSQAKSPLRFTNKYRKTPRSIDVSEKRALRRVIARDLTDRERLNEVLAQIDRTRALPKASKYAVHKLAVLGKAKQLLEEKIEKRGVQDAGGELETLLSELRID